MSKRKKILELCFASCRRSTERKMLNNNKEIMWKKRASSSLPSSRSSGYMYIYTWNNNPKSPLTPHLPLHPYTDTLPASVFICRSVDSFVRRRCVCITMYISHTHVHINPRQQQMPLKNSRNWDRLHVESNSSVSGLSLSRSHKHYILPLTDLFRK